MDMHIMGIGQRREMIKFDKVDLEECYAKGYFI